jgi:hypothetical protein
MFDPAAAPDRPEPVRAPLWMALTVGAVLLAIVAVLAVVLVVQPAPAGRGAAGAMPPGSSHTAYPQRWDRRIAPYAKIAAKQRDLRFEHPVEVRFLPVTRFEKTVTADAGELTAEDRHELDRATGLMRALGLIHGEVDFFEAVNDVSGGGILAYYSFKTQRITIRGKRLTPAIRSTLVHELTHALQDQHFGIGARMKKLEKAAKRGEDTSAASVLKAAFEGDADRVQDLYRDSLPPAQRRALDSGVADQNDSASERLDDVPAIFVTMMTSPYILGRALVDTVATDGGTAAVDDLLTTSPVHDVALLDPLRVLAGDVEGRPVEVPQLDRGDKKWDSGEFGAVFWYLMLAERLPLNDALKAVDGWGGDAYVSFEHAGTTCARATYVGTDAAATGRMESALTRWAAAAPGSPATVTRVDGAVHFEACDPGASAASGNDASSDAITLVSVRNQLALSFVKAGAPVDEAQCVVARLLDTYTLAEMTATNQEFAARHPDAKALTETFIRACHA